MRVATPTDAWEYRYGALGERVATAHNGVETEYVIDPIGYGDLAGAYDGSGSMIASYQHGYGLLAVTRAARSGFYTFDVLGNTAELTDATGDLLNEYSYDSFGDVIGKAELLANRRVLWRVGSIGYRSRRDVSEGQVL